MSLAWRHHVRLFLFYTKVGEIRCPRTIKHMYILN
nr:MAG TPA: hypothetical protein [Bacteriophage sp.]